MSQDTNKQLSLEEAKAFVLELAKSRETQLEVFAERGQINPPVCRHRRLRWLFMHVEKLKYLIWAKDMDEVTTAVDNILKKGNVNSMLYNSGRQKGELSIGESLQNGVLQVTDRKSVV